MTGPDASDTPPPDSVIPATRRVSGAPKPNRAQSREWDPDERLADMHRRMVDMGDQVTRLTRQVDALLRERFLELDSLDPLYRVRARRFPVHSQHEEDGLLVALLREVGVQERFFVEIGCGMNGGNSGILAETGWRGLMVDEAPHCAASVRERFAHTRAQVVEWSVTPGNVDALFTRHDVPRDVDLLSIDIDSFDYWVLEELSAASPRVLVVEYNSTFGPDARVTIPFDVDFDRRQLEGLHKSYFGCSLGALEHLAAAKGFGLFDTDSSGANAIFIRDDVGTHVPRTTTAEALRYMVKHQRSVTRMGGDAIEFFRAAGLPLVEV